MQALNFVDVERFLHLDTIKKTLCQKQDVFRSVDREKQPRVLWSCPYFNSMYDITGTLYTLWDKFSRWRHAI